MALNRGKRKIARDHLTHAEPRALMLSLWPGLNKSQINYCDPPAGGITNGSLAIIDFLLQKVQISIRIVKGKVNGYPSTQGSSIPTLDNLPTYQSKSI